MLRERVVNRINDRAILICGHRCFYVGNEMGCVDSTGLGYMHLVAAPGGTPLLTVPRVEVIGRSNHHGGGWTVFDVTPCHLVRLHGTLLHPNLAQRLDSGNGAESGRRCVSVNLHEQVMA